MAWTTPLTAAANATLTAAQWNASVRDNLLETAPAKATTAGRIFVTTAANAVAERAITGATVPTSEATTSTSYTALTTAGPSVTVTTGAQAIVGVGSIVDNATIGARVLASYAVSGATTISAQDGTSVGKDADGANRVSSMSRVNWQNALNSGSNVFTMQYRVTGGTGNYSSRHIFVIAL